MCSAPERPTAVTTERNLVATLVLFVCEAKAQTLFLAPCIQMDNDVSCCFLAMLNPKISTVVSS